MICQPGTFSSLEIGYAYIPDGGGRTVPVQEVDLPLWAFGEKTGEDPMDYAFRFKAEGVWHEVMVSLLNIPHALDLSSDCREPRALIPACATLHAGIMHLCGNTESIFPHRLELGADIALN